MDIEITDMTLNHLDLISQNLATDFDDFWSIELLKKELSNSHSHIIVAKLFDEIVGFAAIWYGYEEVHITNIVTKKNKRKLGIATKLLENLITLASKYPNCTLITLEVKESNLPAIKLYEKFGFNKIGIRKNYYNRN